MNPAEYRSNRVRLRPENLQDFITWGSSYSTSFIPTTEEQFLSVQTSQLVDARYERPMTWTLGLLLNATQGAWVNADTLSILWNVRASVGNAIVTIPVQQNLAFPVAAGAVAVAYQTMQVPAQTVQVEIVRITANTNDTTGDRVVFVAAWVAPIVE